jgi:hypothetical protein
MTPAWSPRLIHHVRMWSGRVAWFASAFALFVPIRVSFIGFSGAEGPGSCGTVPWKSWSASSATARVSNPIQRWSVRPGVPSKTWSAVNSAAPMCTADAAIQRSLAWLRSCSG